MIELEQRIDLEHEPEDVFAFVTDASNDPLWHTDVKEASRLSDGPVGAGSEFLWTVSFAGREQGIARLSEFGPSSRARLEASFRLARTAIDYRFEPLDGGTRFTRRVEMRMRGPLRLLEPLMRRGIKKSNEIFLVNLKRTLEDAGR